MREDIYPPTPTYPLLKKNSFQHFFITLVFIIHDGYLVALSYCQNIKVMQSHRLLIIDFKFVLTFKRFAICEMVPIPWRITMSREIS